MISPQLNTGAVQTSSVKMRRIADSLSISQVALSSNKHQTLFKNNILAVVNDIISFPS